MNTPTLKSFFGSRVLLGVVMAFAAAHAAAQTAPAGTGSASGSSDSSASGADTTVQEVLVTGSRIASPNQKSVSPITTLSSQDVVLQGTTHIEDLLNSLPQFSGAQSSTSLVGATGTATADLRNLGANRTLVLVDGYRLAPGDPGSASGFLGYAPDLNLIPAPLVDRVEVVTGGASAVYGSDALAGVVNFIMRKNFEGFELIVNGGGYEHDNNDTGIEALERAHGYVSPSGETSGGFGGDVTALFGTNLMDGKGNITAYLSYRHQNGITAAERDYGACQLVEAAPSYTCAGSGTTDPAQFQIYNASGAPVNIYPTSPKNALTLGPGNTLEQFNALTEAYNYNQFGMLIQPSQRVTGGAIADYQINSSIDAYARFMYMDNQDQVYDSPGGIFGQIESVPCSNPLLSASEVADFCTAAGVGPTGDASLSILRRDVEGGLRINDYRHTDYLSIIGAKGNLGSNWNYDTYFQYGTAVYQNNFVGDTSLSNTANALDVITSPTTGQPVCANSAAIGCVPYNIFSIGGVTPAAVAYIQEPAIQTGYTEEQIASGSVTGQLGSYGIKSPLADEGVGVAFGSDYRRETVVLNNDEAFLSGDLGDGTTSVNEDGSYDVYELFSELRAPLISNKPLIQSLELELGYRFSHYNTAGVTNTYKFGVDWQTTPDVRLRASFNRAIRVPNVLELFTPESIGIDGTSDPCANAGSTGRPIDSFAQCARSGVTAAEYGNINSNPGAQYNGEQGGNPDLRPETALTTTAGVVLTPTDVPHLTFSLDYYNIKVIDTIQHIGADLILDSCLSTGDPLYCDQIHRAPGSGSLFLGKTGYITDTLINAGYIQTAGVDLEGNYRVPLPRFGTLSFNFNGTRLAEYVVEPLPGLGDYDCDGRYGIVCGQPLPKWRHKFRATWETPWEVSLSAQWRYLGAVSVDASSSSPLLSSGTVYPVDSHIAAYSYLDFTALWHLKNYDFRVGVNNVLDKGPPPLGAGVGSGPGYASSIYGSVYDAMGRYIFAGITANF